MTVPVVDQQTGQPTAVALPAHPFEPCDAHEIPNTQALYEIILPSGARLLMCGHHAYKHFKVLEHTWLHGENKQEGSDH